MRLPQYLCFLFGHGFIEDLDGRPVEKYHAYLTARCARCGYIGGVDFFTGRLFWS